MVPAYDFNGNLMAIKDFYGDTFDIPSTVIDDGPIEYSLFGVSQPVTDNTFSDAAPASWLATQFYVPPSTDLNLKVIGAQIYVPEDSVAIGKTGKIGLARQSMDDLPAGHTDAIFTRDEVVIDGTFDINGAASIFSEPLVTGWNSRYYDADWLMNPGDGILISYSIDDGTTYFYNTSMTEESILDVNGLGFYMAANVSGATNEARSWYDGGWTMAPWYGIDIIVKKA